MRGNAVARARAPWLGRQAHPHSPDRLPHRPLTHIRAYGRQYLGIRAPGRTPWIATRDFMKFLLCARAHALARTYGLCQHDACRLGARHTRHSDGPRPCAIPLGAPRPRLRQRTVQLPRRYPHQLGLASANRFPIAPHDAPPTARRRKRSLTDHGTAPRRYPIAGPPASPTPRRQPRGRPRLGARSAPPPPVGASMTNDSNN